MRNLIKLIICCFAVLGTVDSFSQEVEIMGQGIDETGLASAYEEHQFMLQNHTGETITEALWTFALPQLDGKETVISQMPDALSFSIGVIVDESKYNISTDGILSGRIIFTGKVNDTAVEAVFNLSLDFKPKIKAVDIIWKKKNEGFDSYNMYYTVEYVGSDYLFIQIEEEYAGGMESQFVYEPYFAHVLSKYITAPYYNWVDITAENKYGKDIYTIELPPYTESDVSDILLNEPEYTHIDVFNEQGVKVTRIDSLNELHQQKKGVHILKFYKGGACVKTTKYMKS